MLQNQLKYHLISKRLYFILLPPKSQQESILIMKITPVLLLILDGFGYREDTDYNAIALAKKPNFDHFWHKYPHTLINASEQSVGLHNNKWEIPRSDILI